MSRIDRGKGEDSVWIQKPERGIWKDRRKRGTRKGENREYRG